MTFNAFLFQALNGLSTAVRPVLCRRRPVADLRRHPHRQYRARVPLYAGDLHRLLVRHRRSAARSASGAALSPPRSSSACIGALIEIVLLRRIYRAPELFQLLATFALVLVDQRRHALAVGSGGPARAARARLERRGRSARPPIAELRPVPDRSSARWCCWRCSSRWRARASAGWCARRRRTARWSARSASIRRCCSPPCSRSAPRSPASAARCRWRASRPISRPTWSPSATPSWWWWSAAWARSAALIWPPSSSPRSKPSASASAWWISASSA